MIAGTPTQQDRLRQFCAPRGHHLDRERQRRPGRGSESASRDADFLENTDPAVTAKETFFPIRKASFGEVLRGVSWTPGTGMGDE